jgi:hypothetical protein
MCPNKDFNLMKLPLISFAALLLLLGSLAPIVDAAPPVRVGGRVQWIAGDKMVLMPDTGRIPFTVDLTRVPVDQYVALKQGDGVVVDGVLSDNGRSVLATAVMAAGGWGERVPIKVPPGGPSAYPPEPR